MRSFASRLLPALACGAEKYTQMIVLKLSQKLSSTRSKALVNGLHGAREDRSKVRLRFICAVLETCDFKKLLITEGARKKGKDAKKNSAALRERKVPPLRTPARFACRSSPVGMTESSGGPSLRLTSFCQCWRLRLPFTFYGV